MSIIDTLNELFTDFGVKATLSVERNPFWKFFSSGRTVNRLPEGIAEGAKAPPEWNRAPRRAKAWQQPDSQV